ncbi:MAG TPA: TatD family hydrolase, partial [bacterium]|nr:TatD family hydrolase [bacterium]
MTSRNGSNIVPVMNTLADTHFHLTDAPFRDEPDRVIARCRDAGVDAVVVPGYSVEAAAIQETLCSRFPEVSPAVGIHPMFRPKNLDLAHFLVSTAERLHPVAIGEIGLDDRRDAPPMAVQIPLLHEQLAFAARRNLPVIIHCVQAHGECLRILTEFVEDTPDILPGRRGVIHRASCSVETARQYADLGLFFSIGPDIFDERRHRLRELAEWIPDDRLLLETDAPYAKTRSGKVAGPWDLHEVAATLADL